MAKKTLKVGHFYYNKMFTNEVYCVLKVYNENNLKWVQVYGLVTEVTGSSLYDSFLGKTKEVDERYWKSIQG